jgi:peptide/nickel transport system substrate-binding protein
MRPLPLSILALVLVLGLLLGLGVMLRQESAATTGPGSAAGQTAELRNGVPQGHVYCGIADEPADVNPYTAHDNTSWRYVLGFTHETLLDTDPSTGELRPSLASSWEVDDASGATFTLRDGVQFVDGSPVTMADVLFGWELARAGHLQFGTAGDAFGRVASAEALDDRRLRIVWKRREYGTLRAVAEAWIVGKRQFFVDRVAAAARAAGQPVPAVGDAEFAVLLRQGKSLAGPGTGPFQLPDDGTQPTTWRRRQDLLLPRNPHHWRRAAEPGTWNLAAVRLLFRDTTVAPTELYGRAVDWFYAPGCEQLLQNRQDLQDYYRTLVYDNPAQAVLSLVWNCRRAPFDDVRVRRALGRLFDRRSIVALYDGKAVPVAAQARSGSQEVPPDLQPLPFDPAEARRELRQAGFDPAAGRPLRLSVLAPTGDPQLGRVLALFVDAAQKAGVEIRVRELEFAAFVAQKTRQEWDGFLALRNQRPWGDPYEFVHSEGADNDGGFSHPDVDRLAAAARAEFDPARRAALRRELYTLLHDQQPVALVVRPQVAILFHKHIQNAEPGPRGLWPERFWVPFEHQRR